MGTSLGSAIPFVAHTAYQIRNKSLSMWLSRLPYVVLYYPITNGIVSSKIYDKWDDSNFEIVNFPFLDGDVPRSPSYGVYISQLIRFARVCSNVDDFNNRKLIFNC